MRAFFAILLGLFMCAVPGFASVSVNVNGTAYTIPQNNEKGWGTSVTTWIQAMSQYTLQPVGGTFTLTADANFGSSYGLVGPYFKSSSSTVATAGVVRLAKGDVIDWKNTAGSGNLALGINSSDQLTFTGGIVATSTGASVQDSTFNIYNASDATKLIAFSASGITTGTTRTFTMPDANLTLVGRSGTLTNHGVLLGAGSSTLGVTAAGSTGQILGSQGASADPIWSTPTYPLTSGTASKILVSDGTNVVYSTPTFPNASATSGKLIVSDGTNWVASTPTYPNASVTAGKIIRSDGTNYAATTSTFPDTAAQGTILNASASNVVSATVTPTLGLAGTSTGTLSLSGLTSGVITIQPQSAAGTYNFNLPITVGSAGQVLTSQAGGSNAMTWTSPFTNPMTTTGDIVYSSDGSGTPARLAKGSTGSYLSQGATIPAWAAFTAPTFSSLTSNGSAAGYVFTVTSGAATAGATYTNNGQTFTVLKTIAAETTLYTTSAGAPAASGTLTKATGSGDATLTFASSLALTAYSTPSTAKAIWVRCVGAGGAGGGAIATGASQNSCGAGGGGGGYVEKLISSPAATYYYYIPPAIAGVAGNTGTNGAPAHFASASNALQAGGGTGGANSGVCGASVFCTVVGSIGGTATGGDVNVPGEGGGACVSIAAGSQAGAGSGGGSVLGKPGITGLQDLSNSAGTNGGNYGAGGGGGLNAASQVTTRAGGTSSAGACFILEIYNGN